MLGACRVKERRARERCGMGEARAPPVPIRTCWGGEVKREKNECGGQVAEGRELEDK